jgi:hypothetical protein
MIVGVGIVLFVVLSGVYLHSKSEKSPLTRDELLRMRRYSDRVRREEVLPFE